MVDLEQENGSKYPRSRGRDRHPSYRPGRFGRGEPSSESGSKSRLRASEVMADQTDRNSRDSIQGLMRVHCGYHKCLTMYYRKIMNRLTDGRLGRAGSYEHCYSNVDQFYRRCEELTFASVSNHRIDLDRFESVRVSRFIRDPRDLLVSGYFYHKRSGEPWCDVVDPTDDDFAVVRGTRPAAMPAGLSFAQYLNGISLEEGLAAEIEFRRAHFESMLEWPKQDERVRLYRYEDMMGNEVAVFDDLFRFYELSYYSRRLGLYHAKRLRAVHRQSKSRHIRNPAAGQWRERFTPELSKLFNDQYGALLEYLEYPLD